MYSAQTQRTSTVQRTDAATVGRVLVVDDDHTFGGFMAAALESRGHDVDWAGTVADAVGSLYNRRYDLVLIDLRLPDGSGLDLLRDATDEGLLADSAAIILTGHDLVEPDDIRVYHKPIDLDPFLDRMAHIVAATKHRRASQAQRPPLHARGTSNDDGRPARRPKKIELVLYTSAESEKCQKAVRAVRRVLEGYDVSQIAFTICDLSGDPESGQEDAVVFTPTLVKRGPGPRTWIVGNLDEPELLVDLLELSGVDRKRNGR
jgi:CheY-like chemotaxis protein